MPKKEKAVRGLASFQRLASSYPYKFSVFAMDGNKAKHPSGIEEWERREPGSLRGVLNAYAHCLDKIDSKQPFTRKDILEIHQQCVDKVSGTIYDKIKPRTAQPVNKGFRKHSESVMFHLISGVNLSKAGCKNVAEYIWNNVVDHANPSYMFNQVSSAKDIEDLLIRHLEASEEDGHRFAPLLEGLSETEDNSRIPARIQHLLDHMYQELEKIPDDDKTDYRKIATIVATVQKLEQLHPFQDANCRSFCLVLLNSLLMQQGFDPAIIDDPNKFDGVSVEELVETVQNGMQETRKLVDDVYEQEYEQRCSESSEESDEEPSYDGYYYLSDDEESDKSETDGSYDDSPVLDTHFSDFLVEKLNDLTKKNEVINVFAHMKDRARESKPGNEEPQEEQHDLSPP